MEMKSISGDEVIVYLGSCKGETGSLEALKNLCGGWERENGRVQLGSYGLKTLVRQPQEAAGRTLQKGRTEGGKAGRCPCDSPT
jgi:hypothetical protein